MTTSRTRCSRTLLVRTPLAALLLGFLVSSCFYSRRHVNMPLDEERVGRIVAGTPASEVVELLGAPSEVVQLGRRTAYRYDHTYDKQEALFLIIFAVRGQDIQQDRVWVFFDERDRVSHVGSTLDADKAEYSSPPFKSSADKHR